MAKKCPFLEPEYILDLDEPCPVCGVTGHLNDWLDGEKCVGDVVDVSDDLHQILGEALRQVKAS